MIETPASIDALRRYFEAHQAAYAAATGARFAAAMAVANAACSELRRMPRPEVSIPYAESAQVADLHRQVRFWKRACDDAHNLGEERLRAATT